MKLIPFILALFILFLAGKPGMDLLSLQADKVIICCGEQCNTTAKHDNSQNQNRNKNCDGKFCNPFQVCGSCTLICNNLSFQCIPKTETFTDKVFTYQSVLTTQFASDFWQPPKIV